MLGAYSYSQTLKLPPNQSTSAAGRHKPTRLSTLLPQMRCSQQTRERETSTSDGFKDVL